jgi:dodecin
MAVARVTEIIAGSKKGFDDAVKEGIGRANKTLKNVTGAWIKDQSVQIEKGKVVEYRVTMKITFILE